MDGARRGGLGAAGAQRLSEQSRDYAAAVDEELRLLSAGQRVEALQFDEEGVDPAFDTILETLLRRPRRSRRALSAPAG